MKNKLWMILILVFIIIAIIIGIYSFTRNNSNNNNNNNNNYTSYKSSTNNINISNSKTSSEEIISTFTTKIYSSDSNRQNNITITCNTLNNTIVANNSTFSFCDTVGKATASKGYLEADIYDKNGRKTKGLGGGNCQVSTTLYNAVLQISQLTIIERHPHSNKVPYIDTGKDAAIAYGSYDFKFRNDYGFDIKIQAINTSDAITINLYKLIVQ